MTSRTDLRKSIMVLIHQFNANKAFPLSGDVLLEVLRLSVYRLDFSSASYSSISSLDESLVSKMCALVKASYIMGLEPFSDFGSKLVVWMSSSSYSVFCNNERKRLDRLKFIDCYSKSLLGSNHFRLPGLVDNLIQLSNSRAKLVVKKPTASWALGKSTYRKKHLLNAFEFSDDLFVTGWQIDLSIRLLQRNMLGCAHFAKSNRMLDLIKVLHQIDSTTVSPTLIKDGVMCADHYLSRVQNLKRIDAAIDELFAYIYSKKMSIRHRCIQRSKTIDHRYPCYREFHAANHSLLNFGERTDGLEKKSSFYSLFSVSSYSEMVREMDLFFHQVAL